jgi:vancomycin resistance protein VanJ
MKTRQKRWTEHLTILIVGYVLGLLIWLGLWLAVGDGVWWLVLVHRVVPLLFAPWPFLVGLHVIGRGPKWLWLILIVPMLVFGGFYYPYVLPHLKRPSESPDVSVMTYNILYSNHDYAAIAEVILTYRPDFVALQEVEEEAMPVLTEHLQTVYPYSQLGPERKYGTTAIFSQHPLLMGKVLDLESEPAAVLIQAQVGETKVTFVSAHLLAYGLQWVKWYEWPQAVKERTRLQNRQAQLLLEALPGDGNVVLLGCDCNTHETSTSYRILASGLANAARVLGRSSPVRSDTARPDRRLRRVDYVFYDGTVRSLGAYRITDTGGSDHLPVLAQFEIIESPTQEP